jgi:lysophospholipase L1-like esterase
MRFKALFLLILFTALTIGALAARAAQGIILGDSIGVGVAAASGVKTLAHNSVIIRQKAVLEQIAQVPKGAVAFISLGTNDAVGSIKGVGAQIERVAGAIEAAGIKAVWIGPVCVIQPWNATIAQLDAVLREKLDGRIAYVSVAGESFCDASIRGHDGVHFTFAGYRKIWALAQAAAGEPISAEPAGAGPVKIVTTVRKHNKKRRKKALART